MNARLQRFGALEQDAAKVFADWVGEGDMGDHAAAEEGVLERFFGLIHELVHQHDIARLILLLQGTDRADADDPAHAEAFESPDIGAVIQLAGQDSMATRMARQKSHGAAFECACENFIGGVAEWSFDFDPFLVGKTLDVVQSASADNADGGHGSDRLKAEAGEFVLQFHLEFHEVFLAWFVALLLG